VAHRSHIHPNQEGVQMALSQEMLKKFETLFRSEQKELLASQSVLDTSFHIPSDELADETDLTSQELETSMRMRLRNRQALFLKKIEAALRRIHEGSFGVCEGCEEPIDLRRLQARPTATHCVSCKESEERKEQVHIDGHNHKSLGGRFFMKLA
jgi:DnaK suppressor protein